MIRSARHHPTRHVPARHRLVLAAVAVALVAAACGDDTTGAPSTAVGATPTTSEGTAPPVADEVVLLTHDSFFVPQEVWDAFEAATGIAVTVLQGGDAGTVINQAILTKDNPTADVLFGIDNTFLSRALAEELFVAHTSPGLADVPDELELDPAGFVTPIDFGDVCLNYDTTAFDGTSPPRTLRELADPAYASQLVVENPATSSPGLAFLLATVAAFPEGTDYTWQDFWRELRANDVLVTDGWETAYYGEFSGGAGEGDRPLVVSYASSPPAEMIFADPRPSEPPTGVITDGCFRQIEFAGILAGSERPAAGRALIDFMLSRTFQDEIALNMFVFPANQTSPLPAEFVEFTTIPASPAAIDPSVIDANRDRWIAEWTELMR